MCLCLVGVIVFVCGSCVKKVCLFEKYCAMLCELLFFVCLCMSVFVCVVFSLRVSCLRCIVMLHGCVCCVCVCVCERVAMLCV